MWDEIRASYLRQAKQTHFDNQHADVSDRIQIPSKTIHKDTGTQVNNLIILLANTAFGFPVSPLIARHRERLF